MERQLFKGITLFSYLLIALSLIAVLIALIGHRAFSWLMLSLELIICVVTIITAIYLLKLKKWARPLIIMIAIITVLRILAIIPNSLIEVNKYFSEGFERDYMQGITRNADMNKLNPAQVQSMTNKKAIALAKEIYKTGLYVVIAIWIFVQVSFYIVVIYYFTRPRVKVQFT